MTSKKPKNWLVLFQPLNSITVDTIKVIDSWSTTNGTKAGAVATMKANMLEYGAKYGDGTVRLVQNDYGWRLAQPKAVAA